MSENPILLDELLKSQLLLERYKPQTLDEMEEVLLKARDSIIKHIERTGSLTEAKRLRHLQKIIDVELSQAYSGFTDSLKADYDTAAELGYNKTNSILNEFAALEGTKAIVGFDNLPKAAVKRILDPNRPILGATLKDHALNQQYYTNKKLRQVIAVGLIDGDSTQEIQRTARMVEATQNLFAKTLRHEINTVARTAVQSALQESNYEVYNQHSNLIVGFRSIGTLDKKTSPICVKLDQVFYSIEKYPSIELVPDRPPRHPLCRTILVAETRLSQEMAGERPYAIHDDGKVVHHRDGTTSTKYKVDKAGTVKGDTTFKQWFDRQDAAFKKDYLGAGRYKLYKEGRISVDKLYSMTRERPLTIEELKKMYPRKK